MWIQTGTGLAAANIFTSRCALTKGLSHPHHVLVDLGRDSGQADTSGPALRPYRVRARHPHLAGFGRQHHAHHSCSRFLRRHGVGTDLTTISSDLALRIWSPPPLSVCLVVQSTSLLILLKPRLFSWPSDAVERTSENGIHWNLESKPLFEKNSLTLHNSNYVTWLLPFN